jgi:hypothetical protein
MKGLIRSPVLSRRALSGLFVVLVLVASAAGCVGKSEIAVTPSGKVLSPKLTPFLHFEDGATMFIGVDGRAAQFVKEGTVFPLGIGLANQSDNPLTFSREGFVLETEGGRRYPLISVEEFNRSYTRSRSDAKLAETAIEALKTRFRNYRPMNHQMYPVKGGDSTSTDSFQLGRIHWTYFYAYFPVPEDGIHGREFTLLVQPREFDESYVVRFALR